MKKIKFIKSPMAFGLGYTQGEEGEFETAQANELVELGYAEFVESPEIEKAVIAEPKKEKAVKK